ncbi:MAG: DNA gyrase subunit A, partial [Fibrobacter sp.]|nr:DNA gyrase subunit A [Fibrobacter sp.]
ITLDEGDELVKVQLVGMSEEEYKASLSAGDDQATELAEGPETEVPEADDADDLEGRPIPKDLLMLATRNGQAVTFPITCFSPMGRGTHGVRGIKLAEGDEVISLLWLKEGNKVLTITEKGYGKRSEPGTYRVTKRGSKGVKNLNVTDKIGPAVFVDSVADDYDLIITSKEGQVIRIKADSIRLTGRNAQGVKAISLRDGDMVQDATALPSVEDIEQDSAEAKETFDHVQGVEVDDDSVEKVDPADAAQETPAEE